MKKQTETKTTITLSRNDIVRLLQKEDSSVPDVPTFSKMLPAVQKTDPVLDYKDQPYLVLYWTPYEK